MYVCMWVCGYVGTGVMGEMRSGLTVASATAYRTPHTGIGPAVLGISAAGIVQLHLLPTTYDLQPALQPNKDNKYPE
jgi:hypothetical protein